MPVSTPLQPSHPSFVKMEDRKRSAGDDLAPPTKRQATNGKTSADTDMPWTSDVESFQKDAIMRQMQEYRRERDTLSSQLRDVQKRALHHDDHLRVVDAWWSQLLDEVKLLAEDQVSVDDGLDEQFPTLLNFKGKEEFEVHLAKKAKEIKSKINSIFTNLSAARGTQTPDLHELQTKLTKILAAQKEYVVKVDRLRTEKEELSDRLETASLRYMKAEKKLDRAKSSAVAKLEQQAIAGTGNSAGSGIGGIENGADIEMTNGLLEHNEESQTAHKEATAILAKQKEQLEAITAENKTLTEQLTALNIRLSNLTEDDYARTELFKQFRVQHEDVIRRINHLEATNIQLREEAEKYQAERTAYRAQVESESEVIISELENQLQRVESDLTRIRSARDELLADVNIRKASQDQDRTTSEHMRELIAAKDDRIIAAELQVQRVHSQLDEQSAESASHRDIDSLNLEQLRRKYEALERQYDSINKELPALQSAYKRVQTLSTTKVMNFSHLEEKVQVLHAEKAKADQKYFAARKDMDTRILEVRALRAQNSKSSEIITQLKEVETTNRTLLSNLEKQLSDTKQTSISIMTESKRMESTSKEATSKVEGYKNQVMELSNLLKFKDANNANTKQRIHTVEQDMEQLRVKYEQAQKERDAWKTKSLSKQSGEEEMLRSLATCTICRTNFKNTAIKTCGHTFCDSCVSDRLANRMRKCPNCSRAFDKSDVMTIHM